MDVRIQCDKNTEFYLQYENDRIQRTNCVGKRFQSGLNIKRTERSLRVEAFNYMSRNLSAGGKRLKARAQYLFEKKPSPLVDCASSIHPTKLLKLSALSKKVNVKSYGETSKYMWQRYANFHITLPLKSEHSYTIYAYLSTIHIDIYNLEERSKSLSNLRSLLFKKTTACIFLCDFSTVCFNFFRSNCSRFFYKSTIQC